MREELLTGGLLSDCLFEHGLVVVPDLFDETLRAIQKPVSRSKAHEVVGATLFDSTLILLLQLLTLCQARVTGLYALFG